MIAREARVPLALVIGLMFAGVLPAVAQGDAAALIRAADAKLYYPQDHGLRDIRADIQIEAKAETTEITRLRYLWKAPNCERWMSLGDSPALVDSPGFFDSWAVAVVRRPLTDAFAGFQELSARQVGDDTVVAGARVIGTLSEQIEVTLSKGLPARLARAWRDKLIAISDLRYEKRGGGLVPSRFKLEVREGAGGAEMEVSIDHQQVRDFWLPEAITIKAGRESVRLSVGRCQINTGLPELRCEPPPVSVVPPAP